MRKGESIKEKEKILKYLNSFEPVLITSAKIYDAIEEVSIYNICDNVFFDGEYEWTATEKYMFEKYNVFVEHDFIDKVVGFYER